jgi:hypothetical protein
MAFLPWYRITSFHTVELKLKIKQITVYIAGLKEANI